MQIHGEMAGWRGVGRGWSKASLSPRVPGTLAAPEAERPAGTESLLDASWECSPAGILVSGLLRKQLPVALSPLAVVRCYGHPRRLIKTSTAVTQLPDTNIAEQSPSHNAA